MKLIARLIWKAEMLIEAFISLAILGFAGLFVVLRLEKIGYKLGRFGMSFGLNAAAIKTFKLANSDEDREKAEAIYRNLIDDYNAFDILDS